MGALNRRLIHFAGLVSLVGAFTAVIASPASASPEQCQEVRSHGVVYRPGSVNYFVRTPQAAGAKAHQHRYGCFNVAIFGDPFGGYFFQVHVQDMIDVSLGANPNDDAGIIQIEYQTPGTTPWHPWTFDQNSADWNVAWGTLGPFEAITHGDATRWRWRIRITTHWHDGIRWQWDNTASEPFNMPR
jgi:hypothetical protein